MKTKILFLISIISFTLTSCKDDENEAPITVATRVVVSHIDYLATIEGAIIVPEDNPAIFKNNPIAKVELYAGSSENSLSLIYEKTDFEFTSTNTIFSVRKSFSKGTYYAKARIILNDSTIIYGNIAKFVIEQEGEEPPTATDLCVLNGTWSGKMVGSGTISYSGFSPDYYDIDDEFWFIVKNCKIETTSLPEFIPFSFDGSNIIGNEVKIRITGNEDGTLTNIFIGQLNSDKNKISGTFTSEWLETGSRDYSSGTWEATKR